MTSPMQKIIMEQNIAFLEGLKVKNATRDAVALESDGKPIFGFRGTKQARDLIPDLQLALNMKRVGRLEEAKKFVAQVQKENNYADGDMIMTGHSLGGFIAEGVRNQHVGAKAATMSSGAPLAMFVKR